MTKVTYVTSESVTEGHPDKIADQISDAVLDNLLAQDPYSRVAVECLTTTGSIMVAGEVTTRGFADVQRIARQKLKEIGYTDPRFGIDNEDAGVWVAIHGQSPDIAQGVEKDGAGDQGMMYGFATKETPELMPLPIMLAHKLTRRLAEVRKTGVIDHIGPDGKSQVSVEYHDGIPKRVSTVVIAAQHTDEVHEDGLRQEIIEKVIKPVCGKYLDGNTQIHINATGKFVIGGPEGDTGVTGRKIIVDTYGGVGRHGGGAFCIAGNARVNTAAGTLRIDDCKGVVGTLVKTDIHPMPAGEWYYNGVRETVLLSTSDGYSLEATPEHRLRILDAEGNYVWKEIAQVGPNDRIAIQTKNRLFGNGFIGNFEYSYRKGTAEGKKKKYTYPDKLTDDYAYLLGLLVGDGDCTDDGCVKICVCESEQTANVQSLFQRLFGNKGKVYGHWAYIGGVELRAYLEFLGLGKERSFDKKVPEAIWNGTGTNVAMFLRGLFDTDGCIRIDGRNKTSPRAHLATTSRKLAEDVQILLLNFGITSHICKTAAAGKKTFIKGRVVKSKRALYNLIIKGAQSIRIFKEQIGFNLPRKAELLNGIDLRLKSDRLTLPNQRQRIIRLFKKLPAVEQKKDAVRIARFTRKSEGKATKEMTYTKMEAFLRQYERFLKNEREFQYLKEMYYMKHYYTKIKGVLPSFAHTYDLNIPTTHTFTANGFVVHNSGKDPTKVDRSGAYAARWVAKNIVAAGLADKCEVQLSYCIGIAEPTSINVDCFGTSKVDEEAIVAAVRKHFKLTPKWIIERLQLRRPIYQKTAAYGHFGRDDPDFTWEKTDMADTLRKECVVTAKQAVTAVVED